MMYVLNFFYYPRILQYKMTVSDMRAYIHCRRSLMPISAPMALSATITSSWPS